MPCTLKYQTMHFYNCYTPDELKSRYRDLVKQLHPDKGGDKTQFQAMQGEYEQAKSRVQSQESINHLPDIFSPNEQYEYFRRSVKYTGVIYNHYYRFVQQFGADILIDSDHIKLIFRTYTGII